MVVFLWRADGKKGNTNDPVWYADAERWATEQGILIGTAVPYTNKGVCPRSDVVFYMYNANQK